MLARPRSARLSLPLLAGTLLALAAPVPAARAQLPSERHVAVELVAEVDAVVPGATFTVALRMVHEPHWHTYWINPGTGYPTTLEWTLPEGFRAGPIQWPTPHLVRDLAGTITGNGYEGEVFLLVDIEAPAQAPVGTTVRLRALADWLMCQTKCVPGSATVTLDLPVAATAGPDPRWAPALRAARAALPQPPGPYVVTASRDAAGIRIAVEAAPGSGAPAPPAGAYFFTADGQVDYRAEQQARREGGRLVLTMPADPAGPRDPERATGVLVGEAPWGGPDGPPALAIDVPYGAGASPGTGAAPVRGLGQLLLFGLLGGLILNLMPCVFPILGIKILGFVRQAGESRRAVIAHGLVFASGILLSFWALAGLWLALRAGGDEVGWGFQLQEPAVVYGLSLVFLLFGLNLAGVFEIGTSLTGAGSGLAHKEGLGGTFFSGVLATVVATPCTAPLLGSALGAAITLPPFQTLLLFTAIALGLALPYLVLSAFPSLVRVLPRPGAWMETLKQAFSFPVLAASGYLLWVLTGQVDEGPLLRAFLSLPVIAAAAWAYGRFATPVAPVLRRRMVTAVALAATVAAAAWALPRAKGPDWIPWSPQAVRAALDAGRPAYVDFTARWCATCQTNKLAVFSSREVNEAFAEAGVVKFKADWTNRDPAIAAELARFGRTAIPFNLIYWPGRPAPVLLPEILTPGVVLDALAEAAPST